jgi:lipopolysaccharide heptosyltransferase II
MKNILIVCPFGIGDMLFTTPLIGALKEVCPDGRISYIGNARTSPILRNDPRIDKVFSYERDEFVEVYRRSPLAFACKWFSFVRSIRGEKFDTAFDLSLGSPLGLALKLAGIPERIGYDYKGRGRWLTRKIPFTGFEGRHVAEYYLDLVPQRAADVRARQMAVFPSAQDQAWAGEFMRAHGLKDRQFLVVYPGGGASWGKASGQKRWPAEGYSKLADKIIEKTMLPIILMGDKNEVDLCERVVSAGSRQNMVNAAGRTSLLEAAALMRRARCVITNDGGPLHVAVAAGARTASVFGPVDPVVYGPFPDKGHAVVTRGMPCQPCYRRFRMTDCCHLSCLKELTVEDVYNQIERLL